MPWATAALCPVRLATSAVRSSCAVCFRVRIETRGLCGDHPQSNKRELSTTAWEWEPHGPEFLIRGLESLWGCCVLPPLQDCSASAMFVGLWDSCALGALDLVALGGKLLEYRRCEVGF